jgi:Big-like domain-containing protein
MQFPLICVVVVTVTIAGCGGSRELAQPSAITATPAGSTTPSSLTVDGSKSLNAIGETSQLTALARWRDGSTRDVTRTAHWSSQNTSVATVSPSGLAMAIGFGAARIQVTYEGSMNEFQLSVTPAGTFAATGDVREPGQGTLAGVHVLEPGSGRSTLTDQSGVYTLAALASRHLRFDKEGYERGELEVPPDGVGYMRMQRIVRIAAGETAVIPKLTHMDVAYDVGPDRCSPCRLVRIVVPAAGTMHFDLTWEPSPGPDMYLWVGGHRFAKDSKDASALRLSADAAVTSGENVVYVGYYRWSTIYGSSIKLELATSLPTLSSR